MTVVGVIGELLITAGVIALLYVGWQMWFGDVIYSAQHNAAGKQLAQQWETVDPRPATSASASPAASATSAPAVAITDPAQIPIMAAPHDGEQFAVLRVPRFGTDYNMPIAGGTSRERTLDPIGIGHYDGTQMPGEIGNFALAAHRLTHGGAFNYLDKLQLGDAIVVETPEGWYTYRFRSLEYVRPTEVAVLDPVPQEPGVPAGNAYITLTSCHPRWTMDERIVAYGVFDSFTPRTAGPPASLTKGVTP